jgi:hypothetical protein
MGNEELSPVVAGVGQTFVHHGVKAGVFLDKDFREGQVLAENYGLEAN